MRQNHWLNEHDIEQTPGDSRRQRSLACCAVHGVAKGGTRLSNWTVRCLWCCSWGHIWWPRSPSWTVHSRLPSPRLATLLVSVASPMWWPEPHLWDVWALVYTPFLGWSWCLFIYINTNQGGSKSLPSLCVTRLDMHPLSPPCAAALPPAPGQIPPSGCDFLPACWWPWRVQIQWQLVIPWVSHVPMQRSTFENKDISICRA